MQMQSRNGGGKLDKRERQRSEFPAIRQVEGF